MLNLLLLLSSPADQQVCVWGSSCLNRDEPAPLKELLVGGVVRSVAIAKDSNKVAAMNTSGDIVELVLDSGAVSNLLTGAISELSVVNATQLSNAAGA
jgi:hypothetical protein